MPLLNYDYETGATYLGITERELRNAKNRGEIAYTKVGVKIRFSQEALDAFAALKTVSPA